MKNTIKIKTWQVGLVGSILILFIILGFFVFSQKAISQAQPVDEYYFVGEYPKNPCPTPVAETAVYPSEHIGKNRIATCFKNNDGISENNELVIAVGSKENRCPPSDKPAYTKDNPDGKYKSRHLAGNYIRTCGKTDPAPPAIIVGQVPSTGGLPTVCPTTDPRYTSYIFKYRSEHIGGNYIGTCVAPAPTPMSVKLTADPATGLPPFDSVLTATVDKAIGFGAKVYFVFDCGNGQTFNRESTTPTNVATASVTQTATCNYTEFQSYSPSVKVYQGDAPITYEAAVVKATAGLTDATTGQSTQIKSEIKEIKIREVAP